MSAAALNHDGLDLASLHRHRLPGEVGTSLLDEGRESDWRGRCNQEYLLARASLLALSRNAALAARVETPRVRVAVRIDRAAVVLSSRDILDLPHLEVSLAALANGRERVPAAKLVGARAMDAVPAVPGRVDVARSRERDGEVVTAADLDDAAGGLERDVRHLRVELIARGHAPLQGLLDQAELALRGETAAVELAVVGQDDGVVGAAGQRLDDEGEVESARRGDKRDLITPIVQVDTVGLQR